MTQCDIVLPVYNGLTYLRDCVDSILKYTDDRLYRLIIVDDDSDSVTKGYLKGVAAGHLQVDVEHNSENLGYVRSCNFGIARGHAPFVLLVNSDVVVTPDWLDRLLECMQSDPRIASVNPLTNHAAQINVPMAPGSNFFGMDRIVRENASRAYPDVVTGVGFCMLLRRAALEHVGVFDEVYGHGYCEESDLCMRLTTSAWRTVVADHVYVYHRGAGSFRDRGERYRKNRQIFDSRWKKEYERQFHAFRAAKPLAPVRELFRTRRRWEPMPMVWETARAMLQQWSDKNLVGVAREAVAGSFKVLRNRRDLGTAETVARVTRPERLRVTYVLRDLVVAGGVLSVIQLVNELVLQGVEARIVALFEDPMIYNWTRLYSCPIIYRRPGELIANFPESDIVVATLWETAPWVAEIMENGKAKNAVYFVQDYEAWFFPETDQTARQRVRETYGLIEHRIVKSDWLQGMLARDGYASRKILLGMDLDRFYPRDVENKRPRVLAMARPGTPRRGFKPTVEALSLVTQARPDVEIVLFGARDLDQHAIPFAFRNEGIVSDHDRLAHLYSEADVFLDGSEFQGFGRCGLEAMACGAACVLTGVGGVTEYARDGVNALIVAPQQPQQFAKAIVRLLNDADLRDNLAAEGLATTRAYSYRREATETLAYFRELINQ